MMPGGREAERRKRYKGRLIKMRGGRGFLKE